MGSLNEKNSTMGSDAVHWNAISSVGGGKKVERNIFEKSMTVEGYSCCW